jgi:hypothetical protein
MVNSLELEMDNGVHKSKFKSHIYRTTLQLFSKGLIPDTSLSILALQHGVFYAAIMFVVNSYQKYFSSNPE